MMEQLISMTHETDSYLMNYLGQGGFRSNDCSQCGCEGGFLCFSLQD